VVGPVASVDGVCTRAQLFWPAVVPDYGSKCAVCEQVQVVDFKERPTGKDYIQIVISVESESQKPILLGRKGSALKQLATAARIDIEDFLGPPPPCGAP